jgi:hypothetical protein
MNANAADKGNRRFFAVASLGKTRWYWIVWPSLRELQESKEPLLHIAEGYEKTKAEAVEKALEMAGRYATWIAAKYASAYHRNSRTGLPRRGNRARTAESPVILVADEFLYRDIFEASSRQWISVPHRVVRKTRKYVYVEQSPHSPHDLAASWLDGEPPTYRLDRQALDQEGYAFIPATSSPSDQVDPLFYRDEHMKLSGDHLPKCLGVLNLSWPWTVKDVQEAYRKLVRSAHPDGGGSHDQFLELQAAYEQALRLCS